MYLDSWNTLLLREFSGRPFVSRTQAPNAVAGVSSSSGRFTSWSMQLLQIKLAIRLETQSAMTSGLRHSQVEQTSKLPIRSTRAGA
jgi:hypothetical protein